MNADALAPSRRRRLRRLGAGVLATLGVAASTVLSGCGADPNGFNDSDVEFAVDMSQHHAQTVQLVNLPLRHRVKPRDASWTDAARTQRFRELDALARLLHAWHQKVPETGLDHADEGKHVTFDPRIPGVLTEQQMRSLGGEPDRAFSDVWLRRLISHERGAIQLAADEVEHGQNARAVAMARKDKATHTKLVAALQRLASS